MASINVSENDFEAIAGAAMDAKDRGDMKAALVLDKIARKINAALTTQNPVSKYCRLIGTSGKSITWRDVPSTLEPLITRRERSWER